MIQLFPLRGYPLLRWPLLFFALLAGLSLAPGSARASHIRAGDIQARIDSLNPRRVFFKMTLYTDPNNPNMVTQPNATIFFGDGTFSGRDAIMRSGPATPVPGAPDTHLNVYFFEHVFPSAGRFVVSFIGELRNDGVRNMENSKEQTFYISTTVLIHPLLGRNRSPVLNAPAIDKGGTSQVFLHNPAAYDADGDSLVFKLRTCQQVPGGVSAAISNGNIPVPETCVGYRYPQDQRVTPNSTPVRVPYPGVPFSPGGGAAIFVMDPNTGQMTWNAPVEAGLYNVAFEVEEWRRSPLGDAQRIGVVIRDMQITIVATTNIRPAINVPADICVVAGTPVTATVTATDGTAPGGQGPSPITLYAYGGILPPATFTQTQTGPPQASGTFSWTPDCSNIAKLPHQVVFKAQDTPPNPGTPPLIDQRLWRITVVGPPPQNLQAAQRPSPVGLSTLLTWNRYQCQNASAIYIYRKEGPSSFMPGPCVTGIPASAGYTRIATVTAATMSFVDENVVNGVARGLDRGKTYCYRIYAEFPLPAGGASIASQEACLTFPGQVARLTHVDVDRTSTTNGQITVRWTQPRTGNNDLAFNGPAGYRISRAQSPNPAAFTLIRTITDLTNTTLVDTNLNTQNAQYTYKLEFFYTAGGAEVVETAPTASSVFVSTVPDGLSNRITVNWSYQVPWDNTQQPVTIYRRAPGGTFAPIGTTATAATGGTYTDADPTLRKFETYCYYVQTEGRYESTGPLSSLLNKSQERCAELNNQPCTPVLTLLPTSCDSLAALPEFPTPSQRYANRLRWVFGNTPTGCNSMASYYRVFYRPGNEGPFTLIDSVSQTSYVHRDLPASGGCYQVQAVDVSGVRSQVSNIACQDNCVFFVLPNIFTPNGDGRNDVFRPKTASPLRRVRFQAYNRWGVKVFENVTTTETFINWDGGGPAGERGNSGSGKVSDGTYFYVAEVEFADDNNTKRVYKGWVEVAR